MVIIWDIYFTSYMPGLNMSLVCVIFMVGLMITVNRACNSLGLSYHFTIISFKPLFFFKSLIKNFRNSACINVALLSATVSFS